MSKFVRKQYFVPLEEDAEDLKVKAWLESVGADTVQWATLRDTMGVSLNGTQPTKSELTIKVVRAEDMTPLKEYAERCKAKGIVLPPLE